LSTDDQIHNFSGDRQDVNPCHPGKGFFYYIISS